MTLAPRTWARLSLGAAGLVLVLAVLSLFSPLKPCGGLPERYPPMIAFELARSQADLDAIFGAGPSRCREVLVRAMDLANWIDLGLFMLAYGTFLFAWFASFHAARPRLATAGMALAVIAVFFDGLEDVCLLTLTPSLDASSVALELLPWMTGLKWLALGAIALPEAALLWNGSIASRAGAVIAQAAPVGSVAALWAPATFGPLVSLAVTLAWLPCLASAVVRARADGLIAAPRAR